MPPRNSLLEQPMSSAERVRRTRWVSRVEETALKLRNLLEIVPDPLPRNPQIPADLIEKLMPYLRPESKHGERPPIRALMLGNGNQQRNKSVALKFCAKHLSAELLDHRTIRSKRWGLCHVSAFTHPNGAMVSSPKNPVFGSRDWHKRDHMILLRDLGDGRCVIYIVVIELLYELRTIGHHGVRWEDVEKISKHTEIVSSEAVIDAVG